MKKNQNDKNQKKIQQAVYKFHLSDEQLRDLQTSFDIFDKDGTGNIDIKDLKVILRALGFEPQEDEIKKLLSTINRSDEDDGNKKGFSSNTIDWSEFLEIMKNKLRESEEIDQLKVGFYSFCDKTLNEKDDCITLTSLREISKELGEEVSDEELKEMMLIANPELKAQLNEGKSEEEFVYKITKTQFDNLLDRIKSGN